MKKALSLILAVAMCLSLLPFGALAEDEITEAAEESAEVVETVEKSVSAPEPEPVAEPEPEPDPEPEAEPAEEPAVEPAEEQLIEEPAEGSAAEPAAEEPEQPDEPEQSDTPGVITDGNRDDGAQEIATWADLQNALNNATSGGTVELTQNITATSGDTMLKFPENKNVTLDLNGFTLNRNLSSADKDGHVIYVGASARATVKNGSLKGGFANNGGGVNNKGTLTLENVTITGNQSDNTGGGIYNSGALDLEDVTISGNTSAKHGGGIYNDSSGNMGLNRVTLTRNKATGNGGGAIENKGSVTLNGCTMSYNTAGTDGGGIDNYGTVTLNGCTITGNAANVDTAGTWNGGGIWNNGTLEVQGKIVVKDNTSKDKANNLYLKDRKVITVKNALTADSEIHVSGENFPAVITSGWPAGQSPDVFKTDCNSSLTPVVMNGEVGMTTSYLKRSWDEDNKKVVSETANPTEALRGFAKSAISSDYHWYVVYTDTTLSDRVTIPAGYTVNLILMDGVTLTCEKGINVSGVFNIYGQAGDTGTLVATGEAYQAGIGGDNGVEHGHINIFGGTINATGGVCGAGLGTGNKAGNAENNAQVNIYGGSVTAKGGAHTAAIGGGDESGSGKIHIYGGTVTATGSSRAAAIGGGLKGACREVVIDGGTVTATGESLATGIGSGEGYMDCGTIIINAGTVTAEGNRGAAIGSGDATDMSTSSSSAATGTITINGGTVKATGYNGAAGIGAGYTGHSNHTIRITGGDVTAIAARSDIDGNGAAGIGGGESKEIGGDFDGTLEITGGTVTAIGGERSQEHVHWGGAGLGAGCSGNMNGTITISGGSVWATGRDGGAAIGAGSEVTSDIGGACDGTVRITGGTVHLLIDTEDTVPIGHGYDDSENGTLELGANMTVMRSNSSDGYPVVAANRVSTCRDENMQNITLTIAECAYHNDPRAISYTVTASNHTKHCKYCTSTFAAEEHSFDAATHVCTVCGYEYAGTLCTVSFSPGEGSGTMESVQVIPNASYILPECGFTAPEGKRFKEWSVKIGSAEAVSRQPGDEITVTADTTVTAVWEDRPVVKAYGCSLSLEGDIAINFYLVIPEAVLEDEGAYVTLNNGEPLLIAEAAYREQSDITLYEFKYRVAAKEMGKDVVLRAYNGEGELLTLQRYSNEKDLTETGYHYSVQRYIRLALKSSTDAELIALMKAMSDYGSKAQMLFGYDTEHAAEIYNADDIAAVSADVLARYERVVTTTDREGVDFTKANLTLESVTTARLFFTVNDGTIGDYSFTVNGKAVDPVARSEGYAIELKNIAAKDLDEMYVVKVSDAEGVCLTVEYCALSYAYLVLDNGEQTQELEETVKALYLYNQAAKAYFD